MKPETRTKCVMKALGWQGGTVHDLCKEIGVEVTDFLYSDSQEVGMASEFTKGWYAVRTSSKEHFLSLVDKNKGNLQWFFGVASGQNLLNLDE